MARELGAVDAGQAGLGGPDHRREFSRGGIVREPKLTPRLQTPLSDLASRLPYKLPTVSSPAREDPALVFLFAQLRSWSLQTVKGAIAVPGKTEFNVR